LRILFFKEKFPWQLRCGGTVHTGNLMKSLVAKGHDVTLGTLEPVADKARSWLTSVDVLCVPYQEQDSSPFSERRLAKRFANYWGCQSSARDWICESIQQDRFDAVVAVGVGMLPYLDLDSKAKRIWYPADDPTLHTYSLARRNGVSISSIRHALLTVACQRYFRRKVDAAWVVSPRDQRWMQRFGGLRKVDVVPNGVDAEHYAPVQAENIATPNSCVFWGRLDFQPNVDAVTWFLDRVWPDLVQRVPSALFEVCGSHPLTSLRNRLASTRGVVFHENLDDLRPTISAKSVSVFPMVSGAGVKNKVLEAAAMAKPICGTSRCLSGLVGSSEIPLLVAEKPKEWAAALVEFWNDKQKRIQVGNAARDWVVNHHGWHHSADAALLSLAGVRR